MKILALDIATQTGWAHSDGTSGTQSFELRRGDSPGMRFIYFRNWLKIMIGNGNVDLIVYEQAGVHQSRAATHVCEGLIATAESVAAEANVNITARTPSAIKLHALGNTPGKKDKARMMNAAENKWRDVFVQDDNQADAMWLLDLVQSEMK